MRQTAGSGGSTDDQPASMSDGYEDRSMPPRDDGESELVEFISGYEEYIFSKGEDGGIPGSIKVAKLATAFVGGLIFAFYTIPIKVIQRAQTEVIGAVDAFGGWLTSVVESLFGGSAESIAATIPPVESFVQQMGPLGLPVSVLIGLLLAWMFWRVVS